MLSRLARLVLWVIVHLLYASARHLCEVGRWLRLTLRTTSGNCDSAFGRLSALRKVPAHLAVLLDDSRNGYAYCELALLLLWSLAAGVAHFTFYDPTGSLKKNEERLFAAVEKLKVNVPGQIKWIDKPNSIINGYTNGTKHRITVSIVTLDDGRRKMASAVKDMCNDINLKLLDSDSVSVETVNSYLSKVYPPIPEPNLAMYCGEMCCTNGFLPWHIRLTEFLSIGSHRSVNVEKFVELLQTYGKCEQRFGK